MLFAKQIEKLYRAQLFSRQEISPAVFYFAAEDFKGLQKTPYPFTATAGHKLQGYFYYYENPISDRIVVFDHGMGAGHRAYMKEIEMLARHGFLVFAYDHTGCVESEGDSTNGFTQSLSDLDACLKALKADKSYQNMKISVIGHSWGAFSCLNISALHPDLCHVVAISGFISVEQILKQNFSGIMKPFRKYIYAIEKNANPAYVMHDAVSSLKNTNAKILLIYSNDDKLVKQAFHYDVLKQSLSDRPNIRFILTENKGHNPNYTKDAVKYKDTFFAILSKKMKKHELDKETAQKAFAKSFDWDRMTAQDEAVWAEIFQTLDT